VLDLAFSLALTAGTLIVAVAYAQRLSRAGAARHARVDRAGSSPLLGKGVMEMGYWAMRPVARACIALGVSANVVSWTSLVLAAAAGGSLAFGHFGVGAWLSVTSSMCDALDGLVARETGTASDSGEVLDATVDRYAELFFLGGVALHERNDPLSLALTIAAIAGAVMVSYATAKAEALGVEAPRGSMRREERAVYLAVGVALVPIVTAASQRWAIPVWIERAPLLSALTLVAAVGNFSAIRRLRAVAQALRKPGSVLAGNAQDGQALVRDGHAAAGDALR
jgi:CDP-diacylglycerol--glycerol-3-phosphate 3-phosphatidyltransferase